MKTKYRRLFLTVILGILVSAPRAFANLSDDRLALCNTYINNNSDFKLIPSGACPQTDNDYVGSCFQHEVDGVKATFGIETAGTCASSFLKRQHGSGQFLSEPHINYDDDNDRSIGLNFIPLDYKGQLFFREGHRLGKITKSGMDIYCTITVDKIGLDHALPALNPICQNFEDNKFQDMGKVLDEAQAAHWIRKHKISGSKGSSSAPDRPKKLYTAKLLGDETTFDLVQYLYEVSSGCTCSANALSLYEVAPAKDSMAKLPYKNSAFSEKLSRLLGYCQNNENWTVIRIFDRDYVMHEVENRDLYEYTADGFVRICQQLAKYKITPKLYRLP